MKEKCYVLFEHTADIGIGVKGKDLKTLFTCAARALFDIIAEKKPRQKNAQRVIKIKQEAGDLEELFVNWLNELLSLSSAKGLIFNRFKINKLGKFNLEAVVTGCNARNYRVNAEIKAATYHRLKIEKAKSGWQAEVILDV